MFSIEPPTHCPSCEFQLIWVNDTLYCKNVSCSAKVEKRIEHFAKTLKIKGLGPATISKLGFSSICDIYNTPEQDIVAGLSSSPLAKKLFNEIQLSTKAPLNILLAGFSIPLIGNTAANKLSTVCIDVAEINEKSCKEAGLGPKATNNILSWLELDLPLIREHLPFDFKFARKNNTPDAKLGIVCITGKLKSFTSKALATAALEEAGYVVKSTLTKDVTILINEGGVESSKTTKARESGVNVINDILILLEK